MWILLIDLLCVALALLALKAYPLSTASLIRANLQNALALRMHDVLQIIVVVAMLYGLLPVEEFCPTVSVVVELRPLVPMVFQQSNATLIPVWYPTAQV